MLCAYVIKKISKGARRRTGYKGNEDTRKQLTSASLVPCVYCLLHSRVRGEINSSSDFRQEFSFLQEESTENFVKKKVHKHELAQEAREKAEENPRLNQFENSSAISHTGMISSLLLWSSNVHARVIKLLCVKFSDIFFLKKLRVTFLRKCSCVMLWSVVKI